jgi:hypothetical protein
MGTFGETRDRIRRDLQRTDVDTEIKESIVDAIKHFQDEPLWINQVTGIVDTSTTSEDVDGKAVAQYALPSDYSSDLYVSLDDNAIVTQLTKLSYEDLEQMDTVSSSSTSGPLEGVPSYWAFDGAATSAYATGRIRVYPLPQAPKYSNSVGAAAVQSTAPYKLRLRYSAKIPAPELNDDASFTNFWFNEAERMIRCYAKGLIYADVLQQFEIAQAQEKMSELEYNRLVTKTEERELLATISPAGV